ncbi:hypothetical protein GEMRC1_011961 [Eukaryota sp. GEM-RC1]
MDNPSLYARIAQLQKQHKLTDVKIYLGPLMFPAHRVILSLFLNDNCLDHLLNDDLKFLASSAPEIEKIHSILQSLYGETVLIPTSLTSIESLWAQKLGYTQLNEFIKDKQDSASTLSFTNSCSTFLSLLIKKERDISLHYNKVTIDSHIIALCGYSSYFLERFSPSRNRPSEPIAISFSNEFSVNVDVVDEFFLLFYNSLTISLTLENVFSFLVLSLFFGVAFVQYTCEQFIYSLNDIVTPLASFLQSSTLTEAKCLTESCFFPAMSYIPDSIHPISFSNLDVFTSLFSHDVDVWWLLKCLVLNSHVLEPDDLEMILTDYLSNVEHQSLQIFYEITKPLFEKPIFSDVLFKLSKELLNGRIPSEFVPVDMLLWMLSQSDQRGDEVIIDDLLLNLNDVMKISGNDGDQSVFSFSLLSRICSSVHDHHVCWAVKQLVHFWKNQDQSKQSQSNLIADFMSVLESLNLPSTVSDLEHFLDSIYQLLSDPSLSSMMYKFMTHKFYPKLCSAQQDQSDSLRKEVETLQGECAKQASELEVQKSKYKSLTNEITKEKKSAWASKKEVEKLKKLNSVLQQDYLLTFKKLQQFETGQESPSKVDDVSDLELTTVSEILER